MALAARAATLHQDPLRQVREVRAYATHGSLAMAHACMDEVSGATHERRELGSVRHLS